MGYTTTAADGRKSKAKSAKWYGVFVDYSGELRRLPLFEDRRASEAMARIVDRLNSLRSSNDTLPPDLARAVDEMPSPMLASLAKWNIIKPEKAATTKTLAQHIDDWKAAILADGSTADHAEKTTGRARRLFDACGFKQYSDLLAHDVLIALADMRKDRTSTDGKVTRGISPQTSNFYLGAVKQFAAWMVKNRRATESRLIELDRLNVGLDRRHDRRALSVDELRWLLEVTERGYSKPGPDGKPLQVVQVVDRLGMSGVDRAMLYRLAVETGLRAAELRSLTRRSFHLGDNPNVTIAAAYAKNRRQDTLPLKPDTAEALDRHFADKMPTAPAFAMPKSDKIIDLMTADLAAARAAWIADAGSQDERDQREAGTFLMYRDDAGRCADFHALRHTFISNLAAGGVHPKTAQRLARHSTITLTMDRYTHLRREDLAGALDTLPNLSNTRHVAVMTGTDGGEICLSPSLSPNVKIGSTPSHALALDAGNVADSDSSGIIGENADFPGNSASFGSIAQRLEQGSHKPLVLGSNPSTPIPKIPVWLLHVNWIPVLRIIVPADWRKRSGGKLRSARVMRVTFEILSNVCHIADCQDRHR